MRLPRRRFNAALAAGLGLGAWPAAHAQFRVEISGIGATQLPVAITRFRDEDKAGQPISAIIRADLERSGVFRVVDSSGTLDERSAPAFADWRGRGADALVSGSASKLADGRFDVRFKLWDVVKGTDLVGQALAVPAADLRLAAHRIADEVHQRLTGERGVNATRIAYVTKAANRYALRITDADGEGGQVALASPQPIISPAWSPDGRQLSYVSFEAGKAVVMLQDVSSGERRSVASFRGSNSAPAWSPDGRRLAVTLSRDGVSQLYLIDLDGGNLRRLTTTNAIDTEAVFAPDGQSIYFVSDRGGAPQVYRMPASGGAAERVTFSGGYNISPALSPDGRTLAYVTRDGGAFRVMTLELGGGAPVAVSDTRDDESPSFAPNGRLIIYATRAQGRDVLMTTTLDGKIRTRLLSSGIDVREPAWGPYGR
ncbi:Tol-Pal system beta propeller repeat protein TolB [Ideonella sp. A 288]|uniref:Tol-Pal system beta propeller repeat protein TolB n=1 Tax=Ideonella sp. A 288 TaxID=1962181 RepID=UPI000B4A709B|nr:Tol-Pal system beta propeller repeat protein TolB [Ideonella sp. A 288]